MTHTRCVNISQNSYLHDFHIGYNALQRRKYMQGALNTYITSPPPMCIVSKFLIGRKASDKQVLYNGVEP